MGGQKKSLGEDGWNPDWGRQSGAEQTSAVMEGQKYIGECWIC